MQYVDGLVAIGGDIRNKLFRKGMSVAEMAVLRAIHGEDSLSDLRVSSKARVAHDVERERLLQLFPKYGNIVIGLYRDHGGKFPTDVRELKLPSACFASTSTVAYDQAEAIEKLKAADEEIEEFEED